MVCDTILLHGRSELIRVQGNLIGHRYCHEILAPVVVPFINANRNVTLFQHDNARCHTARASMRYLDEQHVRVLPWPAFSPDLSPTEPLCDALDRRVRRPDPQNADQLKDFLRQEWEAIPLHEIQNLIRSMRKRCTAVVNTNVGHTVLNDL